LKAKTNILLIKKSKECFIRDRAQEEQKQDLIHKETSLVIIFIQKRLVISLVQMVHLKKSNAILKNHGMDNLKVKLN